MSRILLTGAAGFVGRAVLFRLHQAAHPLRITLRQAHDRPAPAGIETVAVPDIGPDTDWSRALAGIDTVVHLAARVQPEKDRSVDPASEFFRVNAAGTRRLAEAAVAAGVSRMVLLSTVKVAGSVTAPGAVLDEGLPITPVGPYGRSKAEAEALLRATAEGQIHWIALRAPLVYGPRVRGNFLRLLRLCDAGIPLPLAAVHNARSVIGLGNLADAVRAAVEAPHLPSGTYYVADEKDVSTPELVCLLAAALGRPLHLFPVPSVLLRLALRSVGGREAAESLLNSLRVDSARFRRLAAWTPPTSTACGIQDTVDWFRGTDRSSALGSSPSHDR